ncbi:TraB/GumN family protein [Methylotenera sp.]|uniref:TraB/GumN family protein n=1 Tax=Methylotenera sp. TaxID=2051956 RepID=UPI002736E3F4|nr:TraB/GumN family protein [Methylotenera sp.]MDP3776885.1 TraB/GumN family protein [Methylotenera sp.]
MLNFCKSLLYALFLSLLSITAFAEQGLFWKAESNSSKPIYLFGTIHTDDNRVTDFPPQVIAALKSVDVFMMEVEPPKDTSMLQMQDANLSAMLSAQELEQLYALADFHVMHRDAALRTKPWLLAVVFDSPRPLTPYAQDNLLMRLAEDSGKEVIGLETAVEHFSVMDSLTLDEQLAFLRKVLKRSQKIKERDYERLLKAYLKGDADKLNAINDQMTGSMLPADLWARMRVKLLGERNLVMAERMLTKAQDKSLFVAVGASHLAGKTGLVAKLKQAGYKISVVK